MIDWFFNLFSTREKTGSLASRYWNSEPSLIKLEGIGTYGNLNIGWIYSGLFYQDRYWDIPDPFDIDSQTGPHQQLGGGWYRYQLAIL